MFLCLFSGKFSNFSLQTLPSKKHSWTKSSNLWPSTSRKESSISSKSCKHIDHSKIKMAGDKGSRSNPLQPILLFQGAARCKVLHKGGNLRIRVALAYIDFQAMVKMIAMPFQAYSGLYAAICRGRVEIFRQIREKEMSRIIFRGVKIKKSG